MAKLTRLGTLAFIGSLSVVAAAATSNLGAQTVSPSLYAGLTWRCVGPFEGGPVASVTGTPGEPGVYVITTPSGGAWKTADGGETWTSIDPKSAAVTAADADPHRWNDPANPRRIVRVDAQGIAVSLDGGGTWVASHHLPIAEVAHLMPRSVRPEAAVPRRTIAGKPVNVSIADPVRAGLVFAGTNDSVYVSFDDGTSWDPLRLNLPSVAINDLDIRGNDLIAATQGRSVWELDDISPLRQLNAAMASTAVILFKPADAVLVENTPGAAFAPSPDGVNVDYYLAVPASGEVRLEIADHDGRVMHAATSIIADTTDRWLPVTRPLSAAPGAHRVVWNLRVDPPPAQNHKYAQLARTLFEGVPADPDGPRVLAGAYTVRLIVAGQIYSQSLVVHNDPRVGDAPAALAAERQRFDLNMKVYDAMQIAHREFVQLSRVRAQLKPLLASPDPQVASSAAALDTRLNDLDGSDWTGLVVPDEDQAEGLEEDAKEGKHPDFVPPKPVSLSKDYDDPTSILGRLFTNVDHAPAFATLSATFGGMLTRTAHAVGAPGTAAVADYERSCQQLAGVLEAWAAVNAADLPQFNTQLAAWKLPALPIAATVSTIACGASPR